MESKVFTSLFAAAATIFFVGCATTSQPRQPAAVTRKYDAEKVRLLKDLAAEGVLVQIADGVFRDTPSRQIGERCRRSSESAWADRLFDYLRVFDRQPGLLRKIHVVELKRGDEPQVMITQDLDGVTILQILYAKFERRERIATLGDIPCSESDMELIGKDAVITEFRWPDESQLATELSKAPDRRDVERFRFDRRFLQWLADRATLVRLTPELAFERTPSGASVLTAALNELSNEVSNGEKLGFFEQWLSEITLKSRAAKSVKFFGVRRDTTLAHGIQVDTNGRLARKMNGMIDLTFPYVSYRNQGMDVKIRGLKDLNTCLAKLSGIFGSTISAMNSFETEPDSFLAPGHHCQIDDGSSE